MRFRCCGGTLAKIYITVSATRIFATWLEIRGTLWFEPLNIVTIPTVISIINATSSWLSMCAVKSRRTRLITPGLVVVGFHRRRLLAEQVVIEYRACDRRRCTRAEARVFNEHRKRELRLVGRRVRDEQCVIAMAFG